MVVGSVSFKCKFPIIPELCNSYVFHPIFGIASWKNIWKPALCVKMIIEACRGIPWANILFDIPLSRPCRNGCILGRVGDGVISNVSTYANEMWRHPVVTYASRIWFERGYVADAEKPMPTFRGHFWHFILKICYILKQKLLHFCTKTWKTISDFKVKI